MGMFGVVSMIGFLGMTVALPTTSTSCICGDVYEPVCGVDGKTYSNQCEINCVYVELSHTGPCGLPVCACPRIYRPVCGTDGKTYSNECTMKCEGVTLDKQGPCDGDVGDEADVPCFCTYQYDPVCGVDGITYGNGCNLKCTGIVKDHDGACTDKESLTLSPISP